MLTISIVVCVVLSLFVVVSIVRGFMEAKRRDAQERAEVAKMMAELRPYVGFLCGLDVQVDYESMKENEKAVMTAVREVARLAKESTHSR